MTNLVAVSHHHFVNLVLGNSLSSCISDKGSKETTEYKANSQRICICNNADALVQRGTMHAFSDWAEIKCT